MVCSMVCAGILLRYKLTETVGQVSQLVLLNRCKGAHQFSLFLVFHLNSVICTLHISRF